MTTTSGFVVIVDLNIDYQLDIIVTSKCNNFVSVFVTYGNETFSAEVFNHDSYIDIAELNRNKTGFLNLLEYMFLLVVRISSLIIARNSVVVLCI